MTPDLPCISEADWREYTQTYRPRIWEHPTLGGAVVTCFPCNLFVHEDGRIIGVGYPDGISAEDMEKWRTVKHRMCKVLGFSEDQDS